MEEQKTERGPAVSASLSGSRDGHVLSYLLPDSVETAPLENGGSVSQIFGTGMHNIVCIRKQTRPRGGS